MGFKKDINNRIIIRYSISTFLFLILFSSLITVCTPIINAASNDSVTVDFSDIKRSVDRSTFGYILTPNYDIPYSRMELLGPLLNRETIPVQTFQAIGDLDGACFNNENSQLQRCLEAYNRVKDSGYKWYFLLGHNPSWTAPNGAPSGGTPTNQAWFKQYIKDVLQYFKDNGAVPDFADLTNEYWTGYEQTFKGNWEAVREVYPDYIPIVGPGGVGYSGIPDFYIPFSSSNQMDLEGPAWHEFWQGSTYASYTQTINWRDPILDLQNKYPETNGKYVVWEENNSWSTAETDWTRSMANVIRSGITQNIKGCIQSGNWNGMSDILSTTVRLKQRNGAVRTPIWWVYYMFSQLSGQYVGVSTSQGNDFTACASRDDNECKVIIAKSATSGSINVNLNNQPFNGQNLRIDLYKITSSENDGLTYQYSVTPSSNSNISFTINNVAANDSWMVVMKKTDSAPGFFHQKTPDDGEVDIATPKLTWSDAQGATSYIVKVSVNKDLSNPVINTSGITETSYNISSALENGRKYYWSVTAVNSSGSRTVSNDTIYSFIVGTNTNVPGQFGPYLPSTNSPNESVNPRFLWSRAYNASSYRLVVSTKKDLSSPVINQSGITNITGTNEFGSNTASYYIPSTPLNYNTTYYWRVYAVNGSGERPINGPVQYFTTKAQGNSPTNFSLSAPANNETGVSNRAVLSWTPSKNAFFYKLEVSANSNMSNPIIVRDRMIYYKYTTEPNILNSNTRYYWRVTAYTKDLAYYTASSSGIWSFTIENKPCSPLLYAHQPGNGEVKLWFRTSKGAASYNIKYGTSSGNYTNTITGVNGSPYTVNGLTNGKTYYFAVTAVNTNGESFIWNERLEIPGDGSIIPTPVKTPIPNESYVRFRNVATGLYIDGMGSTANGSDAYQGGDSNNNQQWSIIETGNYVMIKNRATGLYLDGMERTSNGAICGQWSYSGSNNQQWTMETISNNLRFKNRTTGLYLDGMGSTTNGSNLFQWADSSSSNQQWQISDTDTGTCGDVNSSGVVDITDALLISQYYVGKNPTNFNQEVADVNGDGSITIQDALLAAQYYVGIINALSCN